MACYSNETKHKCSKIVIYISIALFVLGIATTAFGVLQSGQAKSYTSDFANFDLKGGFVAGTIIGGILAIVVAILGCLTGKYKKFFFALPFSILTFILFIILAIAGAIMAGDKGTI